MLILIGIIYVIMVIIIYLIILGSSMTKTQKEKFIEDDEQMKYLNKNRKEVKRWIAK